MHFSELIYRKFLIIVIAFLELIRIVLSTTRDAIVFSFLFRNF